MIDWSRAYSAEFSICPVDPSTWADAGALSGVSSLSVKASRTDSVPLLAEAEVEVDGEAPEGWHRAYMSASQGAERERVALGTFLFTRSRGRRGRGSASSTASGRSALAPAEDELLAAGSYAPAGADGAAYAASLLASATPAPVASEGSFALSQNVVFPVGMSVLEAAWLVVRAGGFCMQLDGDGTVRIRPRPSEPALDLSLSGARLLMPGIEDDRSLDGVPNRYRAFDGGAMAEAANDDPASPASRAARGRWVDVCDTSPVLVDGETLGAYARRKLREASTVAVSVSYEREWSPGVRPYDVVRAGGAMGFDGDMRVASQDYTCSHGVTVRETAELEEELWRG